MAATPRIEVRVENDAQVITFKDRLVFDDRTVRETADAIAAAIPTGAMPTHVILDFSGVELISSSFLGKLILFQRRIDAAGGRLRLCECSSTVAAVFRTSNLDRLFAIDRDLRASLEHA